MHSATEQLDRMAVDDQPSALTPPVLGSATAGAAQPAEPEAAPPQPDAAPVAQSDGSELTSAQQSVVEALAEMDARFFSGF